MSKVHQMKVSNPVAWWLFCIVCMVGWHLPGALAQGNRRTGLQSDAFEFRDGDTVVLLGDALVEREGKHGYLETRIQVRYPEKQIRFRNLGWSADFPTGQSRVSFDWNKGQTEWLNRLLDQVASAEPTVVVLGYGMANSFEGQAGLAKFQSDYKQLIAGIQARMQPKAVRFILLSPIRHEHLPPPLPDPSIHNAQLELYSKAIGDIAREGRHLYIPLFDLMPDGMKMDPPRALTDDGIHLNELGYWQMSRVIEKGLGWDPTTWRLRILENGELRPGGRLIQVENLERTGKRISFAGRSRHLDPPRPPEDLKGATEGVPRNRLRIEGLDQGAYELQVDGESAESATSQEWARGRNVRAGVLDVRTEQLRQAIQEKDKLFFYRWRPANQTYLFGFRKHEQGNNAREILMFDPLIAEQEGRIAELKKPVTHRFLIAASGMVKSVSQAGKKTVDDESGSVDGMKAVTPLPLPVFEVAEGFEINLFAEDPQLAKPIQMNFDAQGRLWVASSSVYPQIEPGQVADDKIIILEDTNGDGKSEKATVFADGLLIPTGVEPGDGGAYVGQSTELLHLRDLDGDGRADQKRVVLSGFGTEDTHHILHTLRWAPDGQLYMNQSIYIHSHLETPHGVVRLNSGGVLHLRPETTEVGVFLRGFVNAWGHDIDPFGQSFVTDGAYFAGLNYGVPGAMYVTYAGARRILDSISGGGYPKFCSLELIQSRHFPDDWQGDAVTCDFRAHRVVRFSISEQGSGFVTREMPDLVRTSDVTFRPIDVKLGPDGALYIADWSNPIIQHGEVDFRDPRRDHVHGRIWRVTAKDRPLVPKPALVRAENTDLFNQLVSPNVFNQRQARRVLTERGREILPELAAWTKAQTAETALLQSLWMHQSLDSVDADLLKRLLEARDGRVRAAAVRVMKFWRARFPDSASYLEKAIVDEHPRVRLEALRALSEIKTAQSAALALSVLDKPMDRFLEYGLWLTLNDLAEPWLDAIDRGEWKIEGRERQLEFGLQAVEPSVAGPVIRKLIESRGIPRDGSGPWIELVSKAGSGKEIGQLYAQALSREFEPAALVKALEAIESAARLRKIKPPGDLPSVAPLLSESDDSVRSAAVRLAGAWRIRSLAPQILALSRDTSVSDLVRKSAFAALTDIGGSEVIEGLTPLVGAENPEAVRLEAAKVLASLDLGKAVPVVVGLFSDLKSDTVALELWRSLLSNKGAVAAFADGLSGRQLPPGIAQAGMRVAREGGRNAPELVLALARSGNLEDSAHQLSPDEIKAMITRIQASGHPARGEQVYRRPELACVTCHAIGGVGGRVGPDLTSIGTSAQVDYLIESLLYPNRKVKEGYHSLVVETSDGQEFSGVPVRETDTQVIIRNAANQEVAIAKNNIDVQTIGGSIMPSGLIDGLAVSEQIDLFRFLSELGKPGAYDASKGNVARLWRLFPFTIDAAQFGDEGVLKLDLQARGWNAALTRVDGNLERAAFEATLKARADRAPSAVYAAAEFETADAGTVRLTFSQSERLATWVDGKPVALTAEASVELPAGRHRVVAKLANERLPESFRLEVSNGSFVTQ